MVYLNKNRKLIPVITFILTVLIILCLAVCVYFLYFVNDSLPVKIVGTVAVALLVLVWILLEYRYGTRQKKTGYRELPEEPITRFVLMNTEGGREKEWHVAGNKSFLIGKSTVKKEVDIELGDTQYCEYISNEHAVLNYADGYWYIEDLGSKNGVGIRKQGEEYALRLKPEVLYKVAVGDIIYISKAKIIAM